MAPTTEQEIRTGDALPEPVADVEPVAIEARFERVETSGRWPSTQWRLAGVEPAEGPGALELRLHRDETQGYWLNAGSAEPSVFVLWRLEDGGPRAIGATLSYDEAARWLDAGETVDRAPMAAEMRAWLAEYVALHHRPGEPRKRRGAKPSFMSRDEFEGMARREAVAGGRAGGRGDGRDDGR